jgi:alkylation response protein AidB-like acyl-CoA dehydrogenase
MEYPPCRLAERLEHFLGDPGDSGNVFSFANCARLDAAEAFPEAIAAALNDWGVHKYYVPAEYGGALVNFEDSLHLVRMIARRDLTVAIGHGKTFLGGICSWVAAQPEQARALAARVLDGEYVSWGLTERSHGSDLLSGELQGDPHAGGFRVSGEKWLINNATRGTLLAALVRTKPQGGTRGFDVLLIDKRQLSNGSYRCLPKERTLGIRGADISGIEFVNAFVPASGQIGAPGSGLETVLKSLQLTRSLCSALSLGAGDHGLRLAVRFAFERSLYGHCLIDLPFARQVLTDAYADQLLAEAVALIAVRGIQVSTGELSLTSAFVKYLVPVRTDRMLSTLGRFLGARSFLTEEFAGGMYQKLQRDHRIVALFDGNTVVNLHAIINQLSNLARGARGRSDSGSDPTVDALCDLTVVPPPFDRRRLSLIARNGNSVIAAMPRLVARLEALAELRPGLRASLSLARRVGDHCACLLDEAAAHTPNRLHVSLESFALAEQLSMCYAAAAALGLWLNSHPHMMRAQTGSIWRDGHWLNGVLARALTGLGIPVSIPPESGSALFDMLSQQARSGRLLSFLPCVLAEARGALC